LRGPRWRKILNNLYKIIALNPRSEFEKISLPETPPWPPLAEGDIRMISFLGFSNNTVTTQQ